MLFQPPRPPPPPPRAGFDALQDDIDAVRARSLSLLLDWPAPLAPPAAPPADGLPPPPARFDSIAHYQASLGPLLALEAHEAMAQSFPGRHVLPLCVAVRRAEPVPGAGLVRVSFALDRRQQDAFEQGARAAAGAPVGRTQFPCDKTFVLVGSREGLFHDRGRDSGGGAATSGDADCCGVGLAGRCSSDRLSASFEVLLHAACWGRMLAARSAAGDGRSSHDRPPPPAAARRAAGAAAGGGFAAAAAPAAAAARGGLKRSRDKMPPPPPPSQSTVALPAAPAPWHRAAAVDSSVAVMEGVRAARLRAGDKALRAAAAGRGGSSGGAGWRGGDGGESAAPLDVALLEEGDGDGGGGNASDGDAGGEWGDTVNGAAASSSSTAVAAASTRGQPQPQPQQQWCLWSVTSAVTLLRESEALFAMHTYDPGLVRAILRPGEPPGAGPSNSALGITATSAHAQQGGGGGGGGGGAAPAQPGLMAFLPPQLRIRFMPGADFERLFLRARFNASQRAAIRTTVLQGGVTLIQGPPGTGKTTTILGLLNTLHLVAHNYYADVVLGSYSEGGAAPPPPLAPQPLHPPGHASTGAAAGSSAPAAALPDPGPGAVIVIDDDPVAQVERVIVLDDDEEDDDAAVIVIDDALATAAPSTQNSGRLAGSVALSSSSAAAAANSVSSSHSLSAASSSSASRNSSSVVSALVAVIPTVVAVEPPLHVAAAAAQQPQPHLLLPQASKPTAASLVGGGKHLAPGPLAAAVRSSAMARVVGAGAAGGGVGAPPTQAPPLAAGRASAAAAPASSLAALLQSASNTAEGAPQLLPGPLHTAASARAPHAPQPLPGALPRAVHGVLRWLLSSSNPVEACLASASMALALRPRILVTAPSNTAVDGIVMRLVRDGLRAAHVARGEPGQPKPPPHAQQLDVYRPPILRVGDGASADVRGACVHLESNAEEILRLAPEQLAAWGDKLRGEQAGLTAELTRLRGAYQGELAKMRGAVTAQALAHHAASVPPPPPPPPQLRAGSSGCEPGAAAAAGDAAPASDAAAVAAAAAAAAAGPLLHAYHQQLQQHQQQLAALAAALPPPAAASLSRSLAKHAASILTACSGRLLLGAQMYERLRSKLACCEAALGVHAVGERERGAQAGTARRSIRAALLEGAELVLTTTSSAAVGTIEAFIADSGLGFDVVLVDEAAQAVEPSTLIPLRYGASQLVLVGDPQQLPPTILSRAAARGGYDVSLFARLMRERLAHTGSVSSSSGSGDGAAAPLDDSGGGFVLLDTQYRCHPAISAFPSAHFYGGRLQDDGSVCGAGRASALHATPCFRPLVFYNLFGARQKAGGGASASNDAEVALVVALLRALASWRGVDSSTGQRQKFTGTCGVITFYRAQLTCLRTALQEAFGAAAAPPPDERAAVQAAHGGSAASATATAAAASSPALQLPFSVDVNTVDGFQGQERDVVILSCVRTINKDAFELPPAAAAPAAHEAPTRPAAVSAVGFLDDPRRVNVALTRAKYVCLVVGHGPTLATSTHWAAFLRHCTARGVVVPVPDARVDLLQLKV